MEEEEEEEDGGGPEEDGGGADDERSGVGSGSGARMRRPDSTKRSAAASSTATHVAYARDSENETERYQRLQNTRVTSFQEDFLSEKCQSREKIWKKIGLLGGVREKSVKKSFISRVPRTWENLKIKFSLMVYSKNLQNENTAS